MKTAIDIEDLLVWAYRDMEADKVAAQKADNRPVLGSSWSAVDRAVTLGAVIRSSRHELLPGDCDDAALVHSAVLALDDAFFSSADDVSGASVLDRAMIAQMGGTLDVLPGDRARLLMPDSSPVDLRRIVVSVHLVLHARNATRPDCYSDIQRRRGRPRTDGEVLPGINWDDVIYARAVYAVWHAALAILADDLAGRLVRWEPSPPAFSDSPWLHAPTRILDAISKDNSAGRKALISL